jgi:ubiquinone/menaquinone biosynthesis C-methylase UbiE
MKKSLPHETYEQIADMYSALGEAKPHNAYYERPAVQSLVPDVKGKKVLDAGCGPGIYARWLADRGAVITGIDACKKMLDHARTRIGDQAELIHANMEEPLDFLEQDSFDGIISPLAIAYVQNLDRLFKEFSRILRKNGWFVFSTEHPFFSYQYFKLDNYFDERQVSCRWSGFGDKVEMKSYYHSLSAITDALTGNSFVIEKILEPKPTEEFKNADEEVYNKLMKFPLFICIKAKKE